MKGFAKRYGFLAGALLLNICLWIVLPHAGRASLAFTGRNVIAFLVNMAPVFVCIGLLDIWVERETMVKIMGEGAGVRGATVSFLLGSVTALPLYALLPVAGILIKKGCRIANVLVFLCASASVRIPLLLFEIASLGFGFTAVRCGVNIVIIFLIAFLIDRVLTDKDREKIFGINGEGA